jgi:hypothetical protein
MSIGDAMLWCEACHTASPLARLRGGGGALSYPRLRYAYLGIPYGIAPAGCSDVSDALHVMVSAVMPPWGMHPQLKTKNYQLKNNQPPLISNIWIIFAEKFLYERYQLRSQQNSPH